MSNFPTSLDTTTNLPTAFVPTNDFTAGVANNIDSALIAVETKLGVGNTSPSTVGDILVVTAAGTSTWEPPAVVPNANQTTLGLIQLNGDLGGSATAPTVVGLNSVIVNSTAPTAGQYLSATSGIAAAWQTMITMPPRIVTGVFASAYAIPCTTCDSLNLTLTGNATITVTGTPFDGQDLELRLIQDSVGSRTVTFSSTYFKFATGLPVPTLSTAANATDVLGFKYSASAGLWRYYGAILGF